MIYRQGDILLQRLDGYPEIEISLEECSQSIEGEEISGTIILALGEATGHKHQLSRKNAILKRSANLNQFFLLVNEPSDLTHEEHSTITLPPGKYRVVRQRVYSPEEIRYVAD